MDLQRQFEELLRCNEAPPQDTKDVVKSMASKLKEEFVRLSLAMMALKEELEQKRHMLEQCHKILSPARHIPDDILHEIFYHCLPTDRNCKMNVREAPLLLTRICSQWRRVALSSPRIWSSLHVRLETTAKQEEEELPPGQLNELRCEAIEEWLRRSGDCSLSLSTSHNWIPHWMQTRLGIKNQVDENFDDRVCDLFILHARQWKKVAFHMRSALYNKKFLSLDVDLIPNLEQVDLRISDPRVRDPHPLPRNSLVAARNLKQLTWVTRDSLALEIVSMLSQPASLTHLTLKCYDTEILQLLSCCANLVECTLQTTQGRSDISTTNDQAQSPQSYGHKNVVLPRLESINLLNAGASSVMNRVFETLVTPALCSIHYEVVSEHDDRVPEATSGFHNLFPVGTTRIEKLSLHTAYMSSQDIFQCLSLSKHVRHLIIRSLSGFDHDRWHLLGSNTPSTTFDIRMFAAPPSGYSVPDLGFHLEDDLLLPCMESLDAKVSKWHDLNDQQIIETIVSRWDAWKQGKASLLKKITITFEKNKKREIRPKLMQHAAELGIDEDMLEIKFDCLSL